jgi:hypothetical protein
MKPLSEVAPGLLVIQIPIQAVWHAKGKIMVNLYIVNALGQNLANSESCPILRLL